MTLRLLPAVLSGGSGTRLWPLSTDAAPKQLHALTSERTLLQDTLRRFIGAPSEIEVLPPIVICSGRHHETVSEQMLEIAVHPSAIVLEPMGRNSAPAVLQAGWAFFKDALAHDQKLRPGKLFLRGRCECSTHMGIVAGVVPEVRDLPQDEFSCSRAFFRSLVLRICWRIEHLVGPN